MGWKSRALALVLGLLLLGGGLWPLGLLCFVCLFLPAKSRQKGTEARKQHALRLVQARSILGFFSVLLGAVALASGGVLSPVLFLLTGLSLLAWPALRLRLPAGAVEPVRDSILLRSRYFPLTWHAVAELKPGAESFPRAMSSFEGLLAILTDSRRSFVLVSGNALGRRDAESKLLTALRAATPNRNPGAFLLPLSSSSAAELFRMKLSPIRLSPEDLVGSASRVAGMIFLDCRRGAVRRAAAFAVEGEGRSEVRLGASELESHPLVWEVLESLGQDGWPEPDALSNLLDSLAATKGVPLGERLKSIEGDGSELKVESLAGEQVRLQRSQLRAIVSIYS